MSRRTVDCLSMEERRQELTRNPFLYLAPAGPCGFGVFAARTFARGETVLRGIPDWQAHVLTLDEAERRGFDPIHALLQIDEDRYLAATGRLEDFINHSCAPNTGLVLDGQGCRHVALRPIRPQEEISFDYATYVLNGHDRFPCACGATTCRGQLGSFLELPRAIQDDYLAQGIVAAFIARRLAPRNAA